MEPLGWRQKMEQYVFIKRFKSLKVRKNGFLGHLRLKDLSQIKTKP
jgi:hypothetical protein